MLVKCFKDLKFVDQNWNIITNTDEKLGNYWSCLPGYE